MKKLWVAILAVPLLSGCGIKDMADEARDNLRKTSNAVHLQVLTVALQQMLAPNNTESLTPPVRMFPYADGFTKEATPMEALEAYHTFLVDVKMGGQTTKSEPTPQDLRIPSRRISLAAAGVISAFTPHDKLESILDAQVNSAGRFEDTAYVYLMTRYTYIRDFFFVSVVDKSERVNIDSVRKAVEYFKELKYIAQLSYVDRVKLHVPEFVPVETKDAAGVVRYTYEDLDLAVDPLEYKRLARKAIRRFEGDEKLKDILHTTAEGLSLLRVFQED